MVRIKQEENLVSLGGEDMAKLTHLLVRLRIRRSVLILGIVIVIASMPIVLESPSVGAESSVDGGTAHAAALAPTITGATPTIGGIARVGCLLTVQPGVWGPSPVTLTYQWKRNGSAISGATSSTYRAGPADQGALLTVTVTGRRAGFQAVTKTSASTTRITAGKFSPPIPTIYGTARVGGGLGVDAGNWGVPDISFTVQWNRNGSAIPGANSVFYIPRPLDRGSRITATVTGSASGYASSSISSNPTSSIDYGQFTGTNPVVVGTLTIGSVVTALVGNWSPIPDSIRYQWFRDGNLINGATRSDYQLQSSDAGAAITVDVTVSKNGYRPEMRSSLYRKDWQWVTRTETYSAWDLFSRCINFGDSFEACDPGSIFVPSDGVRLYSSGFGDVMNVATGIPMQGRATRWRVTFNDVSKPEASSFFAYNATGINAADTSLWNASMGFPLREIRHENFTTPWSSLISDGAAVFSIGSLDWSSLYFHSVTIEYDTVF